MTQTITPFQAVPEQTAGRPRRTNNLMECEFAVEGAVGTAPSEADVRRVRQMRTIVGDQLRGLGLSWLRETAEVVVSELVTNAIVYGGGTVKLSLLVTRAEVRLLVRDSGIGSPLQDNPAPEAESGRGLLIVDLLTAELGGGWGFTPESRTSWCALPIRQADSQAGLPASGGSRADEEASSTPPVSPALYVTRAPRPSLTDPLNPRDWRPTDPGHRAGATAPP